MAHDYQLLTRQDGQRVLNRRRAHPLEVVQFPDRGQ
jgi:hypothetical protein